MHDPEHTAVCLPWYDFPETRRYADELWGWLAMELADGGFTHVPERLAREIDHESALEHPNLLLSQTCGLVAIGRARHLVRIVATPCYQAWGCEGSKYRSFVVVRRAYRARNLESLRGSRCVINEPWSHSGMNALRMLVASSHHDGRFFAEVKESGSHVRSLEMIAANEADVAAIDCVTYALVERYRPGLLRAVRVLTPTAPAPAPPFVTSLKNTDGRIEILRGALRRFLQDDTCAEIRRELLLEGIEVHEAAAYEPMLAGERDALAHGYTDMPYSNQPIE
ncbi:MAG: phosphate/phosphite/phosphonate ABC transporter substrate-binding protein [Planctomycetota bacterium]